MDFINTSNPDFLGGTKAVEIASQQIKSSRIIVPHVKNKVNALCFEFPETYLLINSQKVSLFNLIVI